MFVTDNWWSCQATHHSDRTHRMVTKRWTYFVTDESFEFWRWGTNDERKWASQNNNVIVTDNLKKKTKICSHVATWAPPPHGPTSGPSRTSTWQYTSTWTPPLRSHDHVAPTLQSHSFFLQTLLRCKKMCSLEDSNRRRDNNREVVLPLHHSTFCVWRVHVLYLINN